MPSSEEGERSKSFVSELGHLLFELSFKLSHEGLRQQDIQCIAVHFQRDASIKKE